MGMEKWNESPQILKRKLLLTLFVGIGSVIVSLVFFIVTGDRILMILGSILFVFCILHSCNIWRLVSNENYETEEGVCTGITSLPFQRYHRIHLLNKHGTEFTILLDRSNRLTVGTSYRIYFQKNSRPLVDSSYLDISLSTNAFLGYEEMPTSNINDQE